MTDPRRMALAKIHIAKKDLAMTDDSYQALLQRLTGKESAQALSLPDLERVLAEFKRFGWQPKPSKKKAQAAEAWRMPRIRLLKRLWLWLHQHNQVRDASDNALLSFCQQHMQAAQLNWAESHELNKCVEALKSWQRRTQKAAQ
jgi:phage gp16-like protein